MYSGHEKKCCVPTCNKTRLDNTLLHRFPNPNKYPDRFRTWKYAISGVILTLDNNVIHKNRRICHDHFESQYHTRSGMLTNNAVPTLNLSVFPLKDVSNNSSVVGGNVDDTLETNKEASISKGTSIRVTTAHSDHNYSIQARATQSPEKSITEETTEQPGKIDLPIDLNSTTDDTKLTDDDLIFAANAGGNESTENTCFNEDEFFIRVRDNTTSNAFAAKKSAAETRINEDVFNDIDFDDEGPQHTVPEAEKVPEAIFSWQKETDLFLTVTMDDDSDSIICPSVGEAVDLLGPADSSMYCDDEPRTVKSQPEPITSQPEPITSPELNYGEYQCNECRQDIAGFRYTCVQCADWDLCGACEARTAHATHYVLRVPSPRPYTEIQAVLTTIRTQLLSENLFLNQNFTDDSSSLKVEVKDEPPEPPAAPEPAPEPDPLEAKDSSEESDASSSPRHKTRSHRSLRPDKTAKNSAIAPREKPVLAVQEDDATISDHIDLTSAVVSDNDTRIRASDKPTRILTSNNPVRIISSGKATNKLAPVDPNIVLTSENSSIILTVENLASHPTQENLIKPLAHKTCITASASDNISRVVACKKDRLEQSNPTNLFPDKNATSVRTYENYKRIPTVSNFTTKLAHNTPELLPTDSPTRKVVHDYLTKRASDNKGTPHRTVQPTDDVICLDNTPKTMSKGNLHTVESHIDTLQSQIVEDNIILLDTSEVPDRVKSRLEMNPSELPNHHQTIVLRVPSGTNDIDLARALQSKVTVLLEPLQVEVIPAKKRRLKFK